MKEKIFNFLESFFAKTTFFHVAGLALLLLGDNVGNLSDVKIGEYVTFKITLAQVAGFLTFFYELVKDKIKKR